MVLYNSRSPVLSIPIRLESNLEASEYTEDRDCGPLDMIALCSEGAHPDKVAGLYRKSPILRQIQGCHVVFGDTHWARRWDTF